MTWSRYQAPRYYCTFRPHRDGGPQYILNCELNCFSVVTSHDLVTVHWTVFRHPGGIIATTSSLSVNQNILKWRQHCFTFHNKTYVVCFQTEQMIGNNTSSNTSRSFTKRYTLPSGKKSIGGSVVLANTFWILMGTILQAATQTHFHPVLPCQVFSILYLYFSISCIPESYLIFVLRQPKVI